MQLFHYTTLFIEWNHAHSWINIFLKNKYTQNREEKKKTNERIQKNLISLSNIHKRNMFFGYNIQTFIMFILHPRIQYFESVHHNVFARVTGNRANVYMQPHSRNVYTIFLIFIYSMFSYSSFLLLTFIFIFMLLFYKNRFVLWWLLFQVLLKDSLRRRLIFLFYYFNKNRVHCLCAFYSNRKM